MKQPPRAPDATRGILERLAAAESLALFFDYDGTLSPFAPRPELATLPVATRTVLLQLASLPQTTVGVISSRRLQDVAALVDIENLLYAGLSGLEIQLPDHQLERHPGLLRSLDALESVALGISDALGNFPGAWLEDKRGTLAVHHRDLDPSHFADLEAAVRKSLEPHLEILRLERNAYTLEIRPTVNMDKGETVTRFLELSNPGAVPLFAGDDVNDEPALRKVQELGGIAIGVGSRAPQIAEYRVASPETLCALLNQLAESRENRPA